MLKALFRFIVGTFAMIGFVTSATYLWARIELNQSWLNVPDWKVVVPSLIVSALLVAYTSRRANGRG